MTFFEMYLIVAGGIAISVVLPIIRSALPIDGLVNKEDWKDTAKAIGLIGLFSAIAALVVLAATDAQLTDWRAALLAGYTWDATIQKLAG